MPRTFSDADLAPDQGTQVTPGSGRFSDADVAVDHATAPGLGQQVSDFFSHTWNGVSGAVTGTAHLAHAAFTNPQEIIDSAHEELKRASDEIQKGKDAWAKGDHAGALAHWKLATPLLGPMAANMREEGEQGQSGAEAGDFLGFMAGAKLLHEGAKAIPKVPSMVRGAGSGVKTAAEATAAAVRNPAETVGNMARAVPDAVHTGLEKIEKATTLTPAAQDALEILPGGSNLKGAANTIARGARNARQFLKTGQRMGAGAPAEPARLPAGVAYPGAQDPAAVQPRTPVLDTSTEPRPVEATPAAEPVAAAQTPGTGRFSDADLAPSPQSIPAVTQPAAEPAVENKANLEPAPAESQPVTQAEEAEPTAADYLKKGYPAPAAALAKDQHIAQWLRDRGITADVFDKVSHAQRNAWGKAAGKSGINPDRSGDISSMLRRKPPTIGLSDEAADQIVKFAQNERGLGLPAGPSTEAPGTAAAPAATLPADGGTAESNGAPRPGEAAQPGEGSQNVPPAAAAASGDRPGSAKTAPDVVRIPGEPRSFPVTYKLKELSEVQPSHSGLTFQPNEKYGLVNDRNYSRPENQGKILEGSGGRFAPDLHITDNADPSNGPPIVDQRGNAIGGNGRTMQLQRVYAYNPEGAAAYRDLLAKKAPQFGVDPADVAKMKQPILVREIADEHLGNPQHAVTDLNKTGTAALTPSERAIADSRRVSPNTLDDINRRLVDAGDDATLSTVLSSPGHGPEILNRLIDDGVVTSQEKAALVSGDKLTAAGKQRVAKLMLGRFFRDPAQLDTVPPQVVPKLERIAAPIAKLEDAGPWNLMPKLQEALDLLDEMHAYGRRDMGEFLKQNGLMGESRYTQDAIGLAKTLQRATGKTITAAVKDYQAAAVEHAAYTNAKGGLFPEEAGAEPKGPQQAFEDAFRPGGKPLQPTAKPAVAPKPKRAAKKDLAGTLGDQFTKE